MPVERGSQTLGGKMRLNGNKILEKTSEPKYRISIMLLSRSRLISPANSEITIKPLLSGHLWDPPKFLCLRGCLLSKGL